MNVYDLTKMSAQNFFWVQSFMFEEDIWKKRLKKKLTQLSTCLLDLSDYHCSLIEMLNFNKVAYWGGGYATGIKWSPAPCLYVAIYSHLLYILKSIMEKNQWHLPYYCGPSLVLWVLLFTSLLWSLPVPLCQNCGEHHPWHCWTQGKCSTLNCHYITTC